MDSHTEHERRPLLVYSISAANLYGTERVAIDTLVAFAKERPVALVAPYGPAVELARSKGIRTHSYRSVAHKAALLFRLSRSNPRMRFITISVVDSYLYTAVRLLQLRPPRHVHVIHGSGFPARSYVSKRYLKRMPVDVVAVSEYTRERLCEFSGLPPASVRVIENFVTEGHLLNSRTRGPYERNEDIWRIVTISRIEKPKRVDLVLDAIERHPDLLSGFRFEIFGAGPELEALVARAKALNIPESQLVFHGFQPNVSARIAEYDLLLHLCPIEPFGIVYLEAMSAGVVAVGPNRGSNVLTDGVTGFLFQADDPTALAGVLNKIRALSPQALGNIAAAASDELRTRYSEKLAVDRYRSVIEAT